MKGAPSFGLSRSSAPILLKLSMKNAAAKARKNESRVSRQNLRKNTPAVAEAVNTTPSRNPWIIYHSPKPARITARAWQWRRCRDATGTDRLLGSQPDREKPERLIEPSLESTAHSTAKGAASRERMRGAVEPHMPSQQEILERRRQRPYYSGSFVNRNARAKARTAEDALE